VRWGYLSIPREVVEVASGGARPGNGAKPDPNALRRDRKDDAGWTILPAGVRKGKAPVFPLLNPTKRESQLWVLLWKKPVAVLWEKNDQALAVAFHVRTMAEAEQPDSAAILRTLVRQQASELLLTIPAMLSARVRIAEDEVASKRAANVSGDVVKPVSARDRLRSVGGA
jgi:hypothetical protein